MSDQPTRKTPPARPGEEEAAARESVAEVRDVPRQFGEHEPEEVLGAEPAAEEPASDVEDTAPDERAEETEEGADGDPGAGAPRLLGRLRGRQRVLTKPAANARAQLTPEQRLLVLDAWVRSKLPATDFAPLVGVTMRTLYAWKKRFNEFGPAGLADNIHFRHLEPLRRECCDVAADSSAAVPHPSRELLIRRGT